jgi:hypothetical protein
MINKEGVQCYCVHGALSHINSIDDKTWRLFYKTIVDYRPQFSELGIIVFNDHPSTTKKDVLTVFDMAIKKAVEDEKRA